jgi:hypothetical protein
VAAVNLHHTLASASGVLVTDAEAPESAFDQLIRDPDRTAAAGYATGENGGVFVIRQDGYIASRSDQP